MLFFPLFRAAFQRPSDSTPPTYESPLNSCLFQRHMTSVHADVRTSYFGLRASPPPVPAFLDMSGSCPCPPSYVKRMGPPFFCFYPERFCLFSLIEITHPQAPGPRFPFPKPGQIHSLFPFPPPKRNCFLIFRFLPPFQQHVCSGRAFRCTLLLLFYPPSFRRLALFLVLQRIHSAQLFAKSGINASPPFPVVFFPEHTALCFSPAGCAFLSFLADREEFLSSPVKAFSSSKMLPLQMPHLQKCAGFRGADPPPTFLSFPLSFGLYDMFTGLVPPSLKDYLAKCKSRFYPVERSPHIALFSLSIMGLLRILCEFFFFFFRTLVFPVFCEFSHFLFPHKSLTHAFLFGDFVGMFAPAPLAPGPGLAAPRPSRLFSQAMSPEFPRDPILLCRPFQVSSIFFFSDGVYNSSSHVIVMRRVLEGFSVALRMSLTRVLGTRSNVFQVSRHYSLLLFSGFR